MKYLIDTCLISEGLRPRPDAGATAWMEACDRDRQYLSVLTLGELQKGLEKLGATRRRDVLQAWLDRDVVEQFSGRILPVDSDVAVTWGRMQASLERAGKPIPSLDGLICATALTHNLVVVTRNTKDFAPTGVQLLNPWS